MPDVYNHRNNNKKTIAAITNSNFWPNFNHIFHAHFFDCGRKTFAEDAIGRKSYQILIGYKSTETSVNDRRLRWSLQ